MNKSVFLILFLFGAYLSTFAQKMVHKTPLGFYEKSYIDFTLKIRYIADPRTELCYAEINEDVTLIPCDNLKKQWYWRDIIVW
jgi:hypothetical protein